MPDVEFCPVAQGEDADALALVNAGIVDVPEFGALVLGVPLMELVAEGEDALLGAALFFVAAGTSEGGIKLVLVEGIKEGLGLHEVGVYLRAVGEGAHTCLEGFFVAFDDEVPSVVLGILVAEGDHLLEFPFGVDVHQGEGHFAGREGFLGEAHHNAGILANAIEHDGILKFGSHFANDIDGLCF